jgi:hypothetical protein
LGIGHWALGIGHRALIFGHWANRELGIGQTGNSFFFSYPLFIIPDLRYIRPYESVAELFDLRYIRYKIRCRTSFCHNLFFQHLQSLISQKEEAQSTQYCYAVCKYIDCNKFTHCAIL